MEWLKDLFFKKPLKIGILQETVVILEELASVFRVQWPENDAHLKAIFDRITDEFGPPDINFKAGSRIFKVHKKVLEKHSSVMKAKLSDVWQISGDVLQVDEEYVEPEVVPDLLEWLYFKHVGKYRSCSTENAYSLCVAAHYLMISELVTSCSDILLENISLENFYNLYTLSKHLNFDDLRLQCEWLVANRPTKYFLSPQVVNWTAEDLKMFIEKCFKVAASPQVHQTILTSLEIWTQDLFEDRSRELEELLEFVPPELLSSDALFHFMETELYSKLDEFNRRQYSIHPYLPESSSSTDKLYCISEMCFSAVMTVHCLDISAEGKWSHSQPEGFWEAFTGSEGCEAVLRVTSGKEVYFIEDKLSNGRYGDPYAKYRHIRSFSIQTGKWEMADSSRAIGLPYRYDKQMLAGASLGDCIYITDSAGPDMPGRTFNRYCFKTNRWEALQEMQADRRKHQLVALDGLLYAIGSKTPGPVSSPERYDPRVNRWEYIAPSNYQHKLPTAVAHEGQIYVLSQAGFEAYSPETDRWTRLPVPGVCLGPSLVSIAGRLWLMSDSAHCSSWTSEVSRLVYEFDVIEQEWTRLPDLPPGYYPDFAFVIKE